MIIYIILLIVFLILLPLLEYQNMNESKKLREDFNNFTNSDKNI
jgi:hypothetical protein